ncbi:MAG: acetyl-CoA carboxylase biotin carboxyl carrier protein [Deltaproteobacteria bacterium]|jgi:acetyl-CoA carboxylase biotin carboxyl carrier protein|nr:acetyl-CoA carboxylase biotin carboxyl carrier protein [Deltaproteobacteria bacterium]
MDLQQIEDLIRLMRKHRVGEIEYENADIKLAVRFHASGVAPTVVAAPVASAAPSPAAAPAAAPASAGRMVKSPMVGTFYRAAKPGSPPFASVGDRVSVGQPLCIIEAMKLMNELESDVTGVIEEILVENGQPVQFGQALFRVRAD